MLGWNDYFTASSYWINWLFFFLFFWGVGAGGGGVGGGGGACVCVAGVGVGWGGGGGGEGCWLYKGTFGLWVLTVVDNQQINPPI